MDAPRDKVIVARMPCSASENIVPPGQAFNDIETAGINNGHGNLSRA